MLKVDCMRTTPVLSQRSEWRACQRDLPTAAINEDADVGSPTRGVMDEWKTGKLVSFLRDTTVNTKNTNLHNELEGPSEVRSIHTS